VDAWARSHHAVGTYVDKTGRYVVLLPASVRAGSLAKMGTSSVGAPMTVRRSVMTQAAIDSATAKITRFAHQNHKYSYGFWFDAEHDATLVQTGAPASVVAALKKTVASPVVIEHAQLNEGGSQPRTPPHVAERRVCLRTEQRPQSALR